jgi:hypothetical protein
MPPVTLTETASTWTLTPISIGGANITGNAALQANGTWAWTLSYAAPSGKCNVSINGTNPGGDNGAAAKANLGSAATQTYNLASGLQ